MQILYSSYINNTMVDAYKSADVNNKTNIVYRIFVTNPNEGLVELKIVIKIGQTD
jgi:hypothetical protein